MDSRMAVRILPLLLIAVSPAATLRAADPEQEEYAVATEQVTLNFESNYWDLYPRDEAVYLQALERLSDGVGVRLTLRPGLSDFSHFEYADGDGPFRKSADGRILIRFEDRHTPEVYRSSTKIRAVARTGDSSKTYTIDINYYPKELYAASGQTAPGYVIVQNTDLLLSSSRIDDWILQRPTPEEKTWAGEKWGYLVGEGRSDYESAMAVAKAIMDDLEPHRGIPSDAMRNLAPFEQYERVMAGKDRVWCGNIAAVFSYACNALDIPARGIGMNHIVESGPREGYRLLLAEGHGSTEIFSRDLNQWVWIDLTFHILNAYLGDQGPINMVELYRYLNDPARLKDLRVTVYDPQTQTEKTEPVLESGKKAALFNYFKRDQQFHYTRSSGTTK